MKTWKILLIAGLAILAVGLVVASAYAAVVRPVATSYGDNYGVAGSYGGYSGGMMRGGMTGSYGYSPNSGYGYGTNGYGHCLGSWGWP